MNTNSSKILGEGVISAVEKKKATVTSEKLGYVLVNLYSIAANYKNREMRDVFKIDDKVVFTATRQDDGTNSNCAYTASSISKKEDLVTSEATVTETCDKFCYVENKKKNKIFLPYSARSLRSEKPFMGKGIEKGKKVTLKIFRQDQPKNQCQYIAWGVSLPDDIEDEEEPSYNAHITRQLGVIISNPKGNEEVLVYSAESGSARIPKTEIKEWMYLGSFVSYNIEMWPNGTDRPRKINWTASEIQEHVGIDYEIVADFSKSEDVLHFSKVPAVVNRVSRSNRCLWLWNDNIGRIYLPPTCYVSTLKQMDIVYVHAFYTGSFEDVPWRALNVETLESDMSASESNTLREEISQLLITEDNWVITYTNLKQPTAVYLFLQKDNVGTIFAAWTDLTEFGEHEQALKQNVKCRVTYYMQHREKKDKYRAVLVTPMPLCSPDIHPLYEHTGKRFNWQPVVENKSKITGEKREKIENDSKSHIDPFLYSLPPYDNFDYLDSYDDTTNNLRNFGFGSFDFLSVYKKNENNAVSPLTSAVAPPPVVTVAAETQTEQTIEREILKDFLNDTDIMLQFMNKYPKHCKRLLSLQSLWKV